MKTVAGIFNSRADAERAIETLRGLGLAEDRLNLLTPGETPAEVDAEVPTTETEQPGMGKALGATVGGALGVAGGLHLGGIIATSLIPGVGPVLAVGMIGAALVGAGGAVAGSKAGEAMEDNLAPELPHDELYIYEDALRKGKSVVIAAADDGEQADHVQTVLAASRAESIDAARETWWLGLRDDEEAEYTGQGVDFKEDEPVYRRGFEAALHPRSRGASYADSMDHLRERHADVYEHPAFRRGYERGQAHHGKLKGGDAG
ncbi:MAG: hypothetical protein QOF61_131 [Acidobacteriota bacterium]|jgi:hypothetical protein|nr:hypothetical protein [Acidobacteriota bacterium]